MVASSSFASAPPTPGVRPASGRKNAGYDMARVVPPKATLERVRPLASAFGITRVANLTGLDRVGIPVVAVIRPNARSYSVAQGKGVTTDAARASGLMEAIENQHAEEASLPLRLGSWRDLRRRFPMADVAGLPRLATSTFDVDGRCLWAEGAINVLGGEPTLVPYELVHLDFRAPRPPGGAGFVTSSNGLASGNHRLEALSHGLCEVIERDANTLWHLSGPRAQERRRINLATVDDPTCRDLLDRLDDAAIDVIAWDTTTDTGVAGVLCEIIDRRDDERSPMPPVSGSGAHPARRIALSRALTEAAQGRLTRISGARDDLFGEVLDDAAARLRSASARARMRAQAAAVSFHDLPDADHGTVEEDVRWICDALQMASVRQILALDLTRSDVGIPVVRVIVPHLEGMSELSGYVPGARARRTLASLA